jgi:two-component system nitrogen regulation sensor histidine kinase NtrY
MTAEIRENRRRLEQSNVDLTAINQRLDRERQLLSTILETARTGIVALDRNGRVQLANPAALEILGLGRPPERLEDLSARTDLAPLFETVASARSGGKPPPREFSAGGSRRAEVSVAAMPDEGGASRGFVIALEDTTDVARAQRLEAWTEAARRVAHEIKNPLTPIKLSAERMVRKLNAGDPDASEAVRQGAEVIIEEVNLLKSLVDQFSRFARMPESRPSPTDLTALVEKTVALYREAKDGVELAFDNRLPPRPYRLDGQQVQRVPSTSSTSPRSERGGRPGRSRPGRGGVLAIQVSDTGSGSAPRTGRRSSFPTSTKPDGSGLGLAIVSRIVADHRGTIRWEENRPRGSRFIIEIPAA